VLERQAAGTTLRRPQEPVPPFPYNSEEATVVSGDLRLAGTFTWPRQGGPFAAVVLLTGSGPQDRDEALFGHKPFLVLSDYLTRNGIAVLRLDDRGTGKSTGNFKEAGLPEFTADAIAAVQWLKTRKEVIPSKIGLVGHSEGGAVGPLAAIRCRDVAFLVMMAGPGVGFEALLEEQAAALMRAAGAPETTIEANRKLQTRMFAILRDEPDAQKATQRLSSLASELKTSSPQQAAAVEAEAPALVGPELRSAFAYDPQATLRGVECPVLAINGALDRQVSADQNLSAIAAALAAGHNRDYTVEKLPGLNHLFQTARTGALSEYAQIDETISPRALHVIADWIASVTK
jgi:pimeloyl-ACP methyl ester carboxylesterase